MGRAWCVTVLAMVAACEARGGAPVTPAISAPPPTPGAGATPRAEAPPVEVARRLAEVELAPDVRTVVYYGAETEAAHCWTFVTRGMAARQHPELVLSVTAPPDADPARFPQDVVALLQQLTGALPTATRLDPWLSLTMSAGALGEPELIGLAAVPAQAPVGVAYPADAVTLLLLTRDETEVARRHGAARIAAMLGAAYRYYPTIWWHDRGRAPVITAAQLDGSFWNGRPSVRVASVTAVLDLDARPELHAAHPGELPEGQTSIEGQWRLRIDRAHAAEVARLLRQIRVNDAAALMVAPDPTAGSRTVWVPGGRAPSAISGPEPGSRLTVNLVGFAIHDQLHGATLIEDSVVFSMTAAERDALATALEHDQLVQPGPPVDLAPWRIEWR